MQRPNGTKRVLRYDAAGQLLTIEERALSGPPIAFRSFQYDAAGRLAKRVSFPQGNAWSEPAWTGAYDDDNRLVTLAGAGLSYDADGNLLGSRLPDGPWGAAGTSSGASGVFTWNARNQLTRVVRSDNAQQLDYVYDAEGNLRTSTDSATGTTRWVTDPNGAAMTRTLARVAPNGDVTRYVYGIGLQYEVRADASVRYYHYDQIGSTIALSDANGAVTGQADYTPYGALQTATGELGNANATPFLFVGAHGVMTDSATGLHQMRARWYSSQLRRFLSEDPSGFAGGENFYAYVNGCPVLFMDPMGLWTTAQTFGVIRAIGGGFEVAAGIGLGIATSWSGIGAIAGGAVALHGLDQVQAGFRTAFTGQATDSVTSSGLQAIGVPQRAANIADAGISIVGSLGAGSATASIRAAQIAAADPLANGLSTVQIITRYETGSKALNPADWKALGELTTTPLAKAAMMEQGVDAAGQSYQLTTTLLQRLGTSVTLANTGLTPLGYFGSGVLGATAGAARLLK